MLAFRIRKQTQFWSQFTFSYPLSLFLSLARSLMCFVHGSFNRYSTRAKHNLVAIFFAYHLQTVFMFVFQSKFIACVEMRIIFVLNVKWKEHQVYHNFECVCVCVYSWMMFIVFVVVFCFSPILAQLFSLYVMQEYYEKKKRNVIVKVNAKLRHITNVVYKNYL